MSPLLLLEFLALGALWGASFLFMRLGAADFGPLATAGLRVGIAAVALLPLLAWPGVWRDLKSRPLPILAVGVLNSAIPFALFSYAVLHISTGLTSILNATVPMTGALVAWAWLKERPGASRLLGLLIGFTGVALLVIGKSGLGGWLRASSADALLAMGACLLATLCYGISASYTKRFLGGLHPLATTTGSLWGATLALALPMALSWPTQAPGPQAWLAVTAVAVLCTAVAYVLFFHIIAQAGPSKALTVTFLLPVFALVYGVAFLGEEVTGWMLGCGLVVLLGTALSTGFLNLDAIWAKKTRSSWR